MIIRDEIIDELLSGQDPQAVFAKNGLLDTLKRRWRSASWTITLPANVRRPGRRRRADQRSRHRRGTADTQQWAKRIGAGLPNDG
jgi:hypothetical protein